MLSRRGIPVMMDRTILVLMRVIAAVASHVVGWASPETGVLQPSSSGRHQVIIGPIQSWVIVLLLLLRPSHIMVLLLRLSKVRRILSRER